MRMKIQLLDLLQAEFENLSITDNSRFEYLFPALTYSKNLISSEDYGNTNFISNVEFKNYEVDKGQI